MNLSGQYFLNFLGRQNVGIAIAGLNSLVSTDDYKKGLEWLDIRVAPGLIWAPDTFHDYNSSSYF